MKKKLSISLKQMLDVMEATSIKKSHTLANLGGVRSEKQHDLDLEVIDDKPHENFHTDVIRMKSGLM
jgi:hypothetical protein